MLFFFFYSIRLLQVTPDLPEVQKMDKGEKVCVQTKNIMIFVTSPMAYEA